METHLTLKHATFFNLFLNVTTLNVILWEWVTLYTMCHNYGALDHYSLSQHKLAHDDSHQGDLEHSLAGSLPKHDWVSTFCWQKERGKLSWRHLQANWPTVLGLCLCLHQCTIMYSAQPRPHLRPPDTDTHCITSHTFTSHQPRLPLFRYLHNDDNLGLTAPPGLMDIRIFYGRHQMEFLCLCQTAVKRDLSTARNPLHTPWNIPEHHLTNNRFETCKCLFA